MANCTNCKTPNEYQDQPFLCYSCKVWEPAMEYPAVKAGENPWKLGAIREAFNNETAPLCKLCDQLLGTHRPGCNPDTGAFGFFDDPKAWACAGSDGYWAKEQWYKPY